MSRFSLPGSDRAPVAGARLLHPAPAEATVEVTVVLHRGADPATVETFARAHDLTIVASNPQARSVALSGTVANLSAAFGTQLGTYADAADGQFRGRVGALHPPTDLEGVVAAVLGLDDRPVARPHFRAPLEGDVPAAQIGYPPQDVAKAYGFPTDRDGTGQHVAIIELGGGYKLADLTVYFTGLGLRTPTITAKSVDGARNQPGSDADGEVCLDIEVIGAIAQGAAIDVYFGPNTTRGFYDAIAAALHSTPAPAAISISWGAPEVGWTASAMDVYDALFADAVSAGVPVYAAAGDDGANDRVGDGAFHVDFPASSPNVVGCGGTTLTASSETVWNELARGAGATGGGVSRHFALPAYQVSAGVPLNPEGHPGRGVPDVSGDADPLTGYVVRVNGQNMIIGGTSAVSPLWSALTALVTPLVPAGVESLHTLLYATPEAFRNVTVGDNAGYSAGPGWDACTGLGSPSGAALAALLRGPAAP